MTDELFDPNFAGQNVPKKEEAKPMNVTELENETDKSIRDFGDLVDGMSFVDPRIKQLWKQIYENAVTDRKNAYLMWSDLFIKVFNDANQYVAHGLNLSKFLERMEKSNAQILKLAELVSSKLDEEDSDKTPKANDFFSKFEKKSIV
jgi:hypothetical protein